MAEGEQAGVQGLAGEVEQRPAHGFGQGATGGRDTPQIDRVADDRMQAARKVHADLVSTAGGEAAFQQTDCAGEYALGAVMGERVAATGPYQCHSLAVARVAADGALDVAGDRIGDAPGEGEIGAFEVAGGEGGGEGGERVVGFGDDHDAGSVAVEAVDDAGAALATDAGQVVAAMGEQRVHQGAVLVAGSGVDDETRGLVEHQNVFVLVEDGEGDGLRLRGGGDGGRLAEFVERAGADGFGGYREGGTVAACVAGFDQAFDTGAGERAAGVRQEAVGALAGGFRGGVEAKCVGGGHCAR